MGGMRWLWVLFAVSSIVVLVRLAATFLPAPAVRHAEAVAQTAEDAEARAEVAAPEGGAPPVREEPPPVAPSAPAAWPEEDEERDGWSEFGGSLPPALPEGPPPEEFDFRRVRWGMPLAEVVASEATVPVRENGRVAVFSATTLGMPCWLAYSFSGGRLARARLSFSDAGGGEVPPLSVAQAQRRFLFLREQLRRRYGDPIQQTTHVPRDVAGLRRAADKQDEMARQYDAEIAEVEERIRRQRAWLQTRYERWPNRDELVARGLAPYERDLRDLRQWKIDALQAAAQSRRSIQEQQKADAAAPLVATMAARWPGARGLHDVELRLDMRPRVPLLEVRYEAAAVSAEFWGADEL